MSLEDSRYKEYVLSLIHEINANCGELVGIDLQRNKVGADELSGLPMYAFYVFGRPELQFHIGFEANEYTREIRFRHGVAFFFQRSKFLSDVDSLRPKAARFDDYVAQHRQRLSIEGFKMWYWDNGLYRNRPSDDLDMVSGVWRAGDFVRDGVFFMLGKHTEANDEFMRRGVAHTAPGVLRDLNFLAPLHNAVEKSKG